MILGQLLACSCGGDQTLMLSPRNPDQKNIVVLTSATQEKIAIIIPNKTKNF